MKGTKLGFTDKHFVGLNVSKETYDKLQTMAKDKKKNFSILVREILDSIEGHATPVEQSVGQ